MFSGPPTGEERVNVAAWLEGLGLGQYAPAFADHGFDAEVLPRLTPRGRCRPPSGTWSLPSGTAARSRGSRATG
jgi:hypothetical protein